MSVKIRHNEITYFEVIRILEAEVIFQKKYILYLNKEKYLFLIVCSHKNHLNSWPIVELGKGA